MGCVPLPTLSATSADSTFYGPHSPLTGIFYLKLGKIALYRLQHALAARWLRRAAAVLRVSHGAEHPVYAEQLTPLLLQLTAETAGRHLPDGHADDELCNGAG